MAKHTTPEENVALMRRLVFECQQDANYDLFAQIIHPGFVDHTGTNPAGNDKTAVLAMLKVVHASFEDIKMEIIQCVGQGNVVATNKLLRGRQVGDIMGYTATGKMVEFPIMDFVTIEDGMIKEHWARTSPIKVLE